MGGAITGRESIAFFRKKGIIEIGDAVRRHLWEGEYDESGIREGLRGTDPRDL